MPREQTRGSGVLENALLLRCRDNTRAPRADTERWSAIKTRDELLFALELLFIIRPHGAVEFLSCFVAEMLLFMELLCCKWCALLVGVRCWLSAGYQRVLAILY